MNPARKRFAVLGELSASPTNHEPVAVDAAAVGGVASSKQIAGVQLRNARVLNSGAVAQGHEAVRRFPYKGTGDRSALILEQIPVRWLVVDEVLAGELVAACEDARS